jgi:hypothetical protein
MLIRSRLRRIVLARAWAANPPGQQTLQRSLGS